VNLEGDLPREVLIYDEPGEHIWHKPEWLVAAWIFVRGGDGTVGPGHAEWVLVPSGNLGDTEVVTIGPGADGHAGGYCIVEMHDHVPVLDERR